MTEQLSDGRKRNEYGEYEFDDEFEESLIALLVRNKDFYTKHGHLVKAEYFSSQRARDLCIIIMKYIQKYEMEIDKSILKNEIREHYGRFKHQDESLEAYLASADRIFSLDIEKVAEYARDKVIHFAIRRQLKIYLREIAQNVMGKDDALEALRGKVEEALDIGKEDKKATYENLPTFNDLDENKPVDWAVEDLVPAKSITAVYGKRGLGKSHIIYKVAVCVQEGKQFFGLCVDQMPVYWLDYENPENVRCHMKKICGGSNVKIWALDNPISPPPKFHNNSWEILKSFPPGLIIIDTFRASQEKNTQDDTDMAVVMNHLKELWAVGHTVIILLHTLKLDDRKWKGNTVILDLADHSLALYRVKEAGETEEIEDDADPNKSKLLFFGTEGDEKSRYKKHRIYLRFDPDKEISLAESPAKNNLHLIHEKFLYWVEKEKASKEMQISDYPNHTKFCEMITGWGFTNPKDKIKQGIKEGLWDKDEIEGKGKGWKSSYFYPIPKRK